MFWLDIYLKVFSIVVEGFDFCKCDFYGRMLVEWKEASGTLDADSKRNIGVGCVWASVALWTGLWPC